ncbi:MAG TPA: hypothetical protein PKC43_10885 [Phycisphaerales bacterium]|nr:hypothetical protein [Phycisphaerales bacterium]HMP37938.1 hypothetical protein [Phycisphaerales bacterium]
MAQNLLKHAEKSILGELYRKTKRTVDDLPCTEEFQSLYTQFVAGTGLTMTRHDVWRCLSGLRKASQLIRKER